MLNSIHSFSHFLYSSFFKEKRSIVQSVSFFTASFFTTFAVLSMPFRKKISTLKKRVFSIALSGSECAVHHFYFQQIKKRPINQPRNVKHNFYDIELETKDKREGICTALSAFNENGQVSHLIQKFQQSFKELTIADFEEALSLFPPCFFKKYLIQYQNIEYLYSLKIDYGKTINKNIQEQITQKKEALENMFKIFKSLKLDDDFQKIMRFINCGVYDLSEIHKKILNLKAKISKSSLPDMFSLFQFYKDLEKDINTLNKTCNRKIDLNVLLSFNQTYQFSFNQIYHWIGFLNACQGTENLEELQKLSKKDNQSHFFL